MNRRRLIALAAAGVAVVASFVPLRRWRGRRLKHAHRVLPPDASPPEPGVLETMADFTGAVFGRRLAAADLAELRESFVVAVQADAGWRAELRMVAAWVEAAARRVGAESFAATTDAQREQMVAGFMTAPADGGPSDLLALVSQRERARRLLRSDVLGLLERIYTHSGVLWRARGYTNWIGVPGDPRSYTRPVEQHEC